MKFGEKEFADYWKMIKIPVYVLIGWNILGLIIGLISYSSYTSIFSASWVMLIAVFGFIGWITIKDYKQGIGTAAWAGTLAGAISGIASAILGIMMYYFVPAMTEATIAQATQRGVDAATIQSFMAIGVYMGLIFGPLITAGIGAAISAIVALIAKASK